MGSLYRIGGISSDGKGKAAESGFNPAATGKFVGLRGQSIWVAPIVAKARLLLNASALLSVSVPKALIPRVATSELVGSSACWLGRESTSVAAEQESSPPERFPPSLTR
jgi:hypothetical protein